MPRAAEKRFQSGGRSWRHVDVAAALGPRYARMPYAARVLAENLLRTGADLKLLDESALPGTLELPLLFPRVILPDSSGVPVLMDLAALRSSLHRRGAPVDDVRAQVPITLVVDHSLQVDVSGVKDAPSQNLAKEFVRNEERYRFLKWAQQAFPGLEIFPPGSGIIHQVHLEQVAKVICVEGDLVHPDMVVGGDSHTPMVNALGIIGWGVGGLEAEMVALGEPYPLPNPEFVGVELTGALPAGVTITDLALTLTRRLRDEGVVGAFVEFFGSAVPSMSVPDRATLANMAPEYGATTGFWPIDENTLDYLRVTGRSEQHIDLVRDHAMSAGLFRTSDSATPDYPRLVSLDLSTVRRAFAGPSRPHNLLATNTLRSAFEKKAEVVADERDGAIAIAAIASCTNTANPVSMITAGLVARNAVARGLRVAEHVKTSLAPGSRAVTAYLQGSGLLEPLEALGFHVIGYGCTTCGGKSGPLKPAAQKLHEEGRKLVAVLSGNRNFDGRIHRLVSASFLTSPALVVAAALAGSVARDVETQPLGRDSSGAEVFLSDLWPSRDEVDEIVARHVTPDVFAATRGLDEEAVRLWSGVSGGAGPLFAWDAASTYIVEPPFFEAADAGFGVCESVMGARALGFFEHGLTTDHVSPGGEIPAESPAGGYLQACGVAPTQFNSYVGRRGNHHVMIRGTYANVRIRNRLVPDRDGWWTKLFPSGDIISFFDAAEAYRAAHVPIVVLGGRDFGSGSSRDWAAKGPALLGVGAVLAESFERIHRSNLIGLGIMPLVFTGADSADALELDGSEIFDFGSFIAALKDDGCVDVRASKPGAVKNFQMRIDARTPAERDLLVRGGVFRATLARYAGEA